MGPRPRLPKPLFQLLHHYDIAKIRPFESMEACISAVSITIKVIFVYRIWNGLHKSTFLNEFADLLEKVPVELGTLLLVGDFKHVSEPTHKDGHIDFVISRSIDDLVANCNMDSMISDHHTVHIDITCSKPHPTHKRSPIIKWKMWILNNVKLRCFYK